MPASLTRYCAVALRWAGSDKHSPLTDGRRRLVLFDTPTMARDFIPILGSDRLDYWSEDGETCRWMPLMTDGYNEAVIITDYDPYDVPNGWRSLGIFSEAQALSWRNHVMWHEVRDELTEWGRVRNAHAFEQAMTPQGVIRVGQPV